ncbi:MAG: NapC/NirT family cytochrome c [Dehalococcoidia bacterium]|nr:NapC/NirT family cytochrome c [Dehalococcoidia bacterium]
MKRMRGFWQKLGRNLRDLFGRPIAYQWRSRRWTLMGTTGVLSLIFLGTGALALATLTSGVGVTVSSNPKFCDSCHEILPAYEQWRTSSHKSVNCLSCHTEDGLPGYAKINMEGLQNLVSHLSGSTELPSQASINNDNCLRCHARNTLPETMPQATLRIAHSSHQDLKCTACHERLVHPRLLDAPVLAQAISHTQKDCSVCHPNPNPTYLHGDAQVACSSCHSGNIPNHDLAVRRNTPLRETCTECHTQQRVSQPESCQTCHVSPHGIDPNCSQCHSSAESWQQRSFVHPVALTATHGQLQCTQCHAVSLPPSPQSFGSGDFLCNNCHTPKHPPLDNNCTKCHQPTGWKPVKMKGQ